jgi:hypothetical protein
LIDLASGDATVCPYVNKADRRCTTHLTLVNLAYAFTYCADRHIDCPVYAELLTDDRDYDPANRHPAEVPILCGLAF